MSDRVIFHIDVNSAYLSWEAVDRLENGETTDLRLIPSAVGGDIATRHGVILAKSVPAKKYRITTGEPVVDALRKCPELVLVKPRHGLYHEKSKAFINILRQYSDTIEQFSVDEAFVDMTGTRRLFGEPKDAADRIRNQVPYKMWPLPIGDLFFAGRSTVKKLNSLGIFTIGDLAKTDKYVIVQAMKKHGEVLWRYANGLDDSPVEPVRPDNKGYGNSTTISYDVTDAAAAKGILLKLTDKVCQRLRNDSVKADTVTVQIKYNDLTKASHQCGLPAATNITKEIYDTVCRLFDEKWDGTPIRLLGVSTKVASADNGRQMDLFDNTDYEKLEKLDRAMDDIKSRFGAGAVSRASDLKKEGKSL